MKEKIYDLFENHTTGVAIFLVILLMLGLLGFAFGVYCLEGWLLMLLWNWLAVSLLNAPVLGYWMCVGICWAIDFLRNLLFGRKRK